MFPQLEVNEAFLSYLEKAVWVYPFLKLEDLLHLNALMTAAAGYFGIGQEVEGPKERRDDHVANLEHSIIEGDTLKMGILKMIVWRERFKVIVEFF